MRPFRIVLTVVAAILAVTAVIAGMTHLARVTVGMAAPAAATARSGEDRGRPTRITIPAIDVDATLIGVGLLPDGAMRIPDFGLAGWYDEGPLPGEAGPAVVVAHVDSKANGPDVFYRLRELEPGDEVTIHHTNGRSTFVVTGKEQAAKTELPVERIWNDTDEPVLRLITCGGAFDGSARSYLDNVIVYADQFVAPTVAEKNATAGAQHEGGRRRRRRPGRRGPEVAGAVGPRSPGPRRRPASGSRRPPRARSRRSSSPT